MTSVGKQHSSASSLNERLDWMFVDLLTLTVGLLIMQVFILPALRSSQATGVPASPGKWLRVQLRIKPDPAVKMTETLALRPTEWGIYVKCNETGEFTHGDDVQGAGAARNMNAPQYGNDGTLSFEFIPRDGETYVMGVWLQMISDSRFVNDPSVRRAIQNGIQFRIFSGSIKRVEEDPDNPLWAWRDLDSSSAFHSQFELDPQLLGSEGDS